LRVTASCVNLFTPHGGLAVKEYWSVKQVKPFKRKSDEEYKERFRELFSLCAKETVQGIRGETGILLSSGLDSSAVASQVAPLLGAQGKQLYAYTHVPVEGHVSKYNKRYFNTNEKEGVLRLCEMYPSILPHFLPLPECDGFSNVREIFSIHQTPYKALVNTDWIYAMGKIAAADGCRVLLNGQMGNATISWGDIYTYVKRLITHGRPLKALSTLNRYALRLDLGRKQQLAYIVSSLLPALFDRAKGEDWLEGSFVHRGMAAGFGIGNGDARIRMNVQLTKPVIHTYSQVRQNLFNKIAFAHIADSATKISLKSGLVIQDITRDIRIFEFCSALPISCAVNAVPETRRLARCYLADCLPTEILSETAPRGRQSGDWLERIAPNWPSLYESVAQICESPALSRYIEAAALREALEAFRNVPERRDEYPFARFGAVYVLGMFLEKIENSMDMT
jgi:asparagine synthase (glutamine-hydrolysing)